MKEQASVVQYTVRGVPREVDIALKTEGGKASCKSQQVDSGGVKQSGDRGQ